MDIEHSHIHLFGNPEENFYILGKRDKDSYSNIHHQISMLCTRNQFMSKVLQTTTELSQKFRVKKNQNSLNEVYAYAEGLEKKPEDVRFSMLLPEIVASFNKWTPQLLSIIPGCSSLFIKDPNNQDIIHTRILDYAIVGPFEKYERSILYEFANENKILSFSTSGMPFPSMTAMNDKGLSLALHYKHGQYFNLDGQSIFMITSHIMKHCSNIREAIKYIKGQQSISYWGIYLSDKTGEVASVDIRGPESYQEKFDLKDHKYLYFNNRPLLKKADQESIQPFGNMGQCKMRRDHFEYNMDNFNLETSKNVQIDSLNILSKPIIKKVNHARDWKLPPTTPSSIQLTSFNLSKNKAIFVPGKSPKIYQGDIVEFKNVFKQQFTIDKKQSKKKNQKVAHYADAMAKVSMFQSYIDIGDISKAYHEIQMALLMFKDYPEYYICQFYFCVTQYIYESDKKDLSYIYEDFENLSNKLPEYLEDHRILFLLRLSKLLGHKIKNRSKEIKNKDLKNIYRQEFNLNPLAIKGLKYLIFPRIEILDIIYAY